VILPAFIEIPAPGILLKIILKFYRKYHFSDVELKYYQIIRQKFHFFYILKSLPLNICQFHHASQWKRPAWENIRKI